MSETRIVEPIAYQARWVFPVDREPIRDGVVEVRAGRIEKVRQFRSGDAIVDLGDVAILPALVNAHSHLELSDLRTPLADGSLSFPDWIREVVAYRRGRDESDQLEAWRQAAIAKGLAESAQSGVCAVGDVATAPWSDEAYQGSPIAATAFIELLGLAPERIDPLLAMADTHLQASRGNVRRALCPHAPYTVHPQLFAESCKLATKHQAPIAFHLAESLAEIELLQSGSGRLVGVLESLGALPRAVIPRGSRSLDYLQLLAATPRSLVIHGNFLTAEEIAFAGQQSDRMSIVYCPRTHRLFNPGDYPLAEMLAANVNVSLGTDSRATNPDLDLWQELRFIAANHPRISPEGVLHLGTLASAEALGIADEVGSITPGKRAALVTTRVRKEVSNDPYELLFGDEEQRLAGFWWQILPLT